MISDQIISFWEDDMHRKQWLKDWKDKEIARWRIHPKEIFGTYKFMCYSVDDNHGKLTKTINEWAKIIIEDAGTTRKFMNYLKDYVAHVDVSAAYSVGPSGEYQHLYTVYIEEIAQEYESKIKTKARVQKFRKSETPKRREDLFADLVNNYHPSRRTVQLAKAREKFNAIMIESSRNKRGKEKEKSEKEYFDKISKYIEYLKGTKIWNQDEGKFMPGLWNFLRSKGWEYNYEEDPGKYRPDDYSHSRSSEQQILELME